MDVFANFFVAGAPETLALNMSKLVLSVLTSVKGRHPLASEVSIPLPSFGANYSCEGIQM